MGRTVTAHGWSVRVNFCNLRVHPYIETRHVETVRKLLEEVLSRASQFVKTMTLSEPTVAGDYAYWPALTVTALGWYVFLTRHSVDCQQVMSIPLYGHARLGDHNLFSLEATQFLDMEMVAYPPENQEVFAFTNHVVDIDDNDYVEFAELHTATDTYVCSAGKWLVAGDQTFFQYVSNEVAINRVTPFEMFRQVQTDVLDHRTYNDYTAATGCDEPVARVAEMYQLCNVASVHQPRFDACVEEFFNKVNNLMIESLTETSFTNDPLMRYLVASDYHNLEYLVIWMWRMTCKRVDLSNAGAPDVRTFLILLAKRLDETVKDGRAQQLLRPYIDLEIEAFNEFAESLTFFDAHDRDLAYFFSAHYATFLVAERWDMYDMTSLNLSDEVKQVGYGVRLQTQDASFQFNGRHYVSYRQVKSKIATVPPVFISDILFNKSRYLFPTDGGVFNVITFKYHSHCPFTLFNCCLKNFVPPRDAVRLPKTVFDFILNTMDVEQEIFALYHVAKVMRDLRKAASHYRLLTHLGHDTLDVVVKMSNLYKNIDQYSDEMLVATGWFIDHEHMLNLSENGVNIKREALVAAICVTVTVRKSLNRLVWACQYDEWAQFWIACHGSAFKMKTKMLEALYERRGEFAHALHQRCQSQNPLSDQEFITFVATFLAAATTTATTTATGRLIEDVTGKLGRVNGMLTGWGIWENKLITHDGVERYDAWLLRFYKQVVFRRYYSQHPTAAHVDSAQVQKVFKAYLYFRIVTRFNCCYSKLLMFFTASTIIPSNYEKCMIVLTGESNSGKSTFQRMLGELVNCHRIDYSKHSVKGGGKQEGSSEELFEELISQVFVMEELDKVTDNFIKLYVDSSRVSKARRHHSSHQKMNSLFKPVAFNNRPVFVEGTYDRAVGNRLLTVYLEHVFTDKCTFGGSIHENIVEKRFPMVQDAYKSLVESMRCLLTHLAYYYRDPVDGCLRYKKYADAYPFIEHNNRCVQICNRPREAFEYVVKLRRVRGLNVPYDDMTATIEQALVVVKNITGDNRLLVERILSEMRAEYDYCVDTALFKNVFIETDPAKFNKSKPRLLS